MYNLQLQNGQLNCEEIELAGRKLIEINKRNTQGYYLLTACAEAKGNEQNAIELIQTAIKFDPLNTQYLLGAAVLFLNNGDLFNAELYLEKVKRIDPKTFNLDNIIRALNDKKLQAKQNNIMENR